MIRPRRADLFSGVEMKLKTPELTAELTAGPGGSVWQLRADGLHITARSWAQLKRRAGMRWRHPDRVLLPGPRGESLRAWRQAKEQRQEMAKAEAHLRGDALRELLDLGLSAADAGRVLGLSRQRVSAILRDLSRK